MSQQSMNTSERPLVAASQPMRPVRAAAIPALFSEGPEPGLSRPVQVRWPAVAAIKEHLGKLILRFPNR
jgi:hypothetical protein